VCPGVWCPSSSAKTGESWSRRCSDHQPIRDECDNHRRRTYRPQQNVINTMASAFGPVTWVMSSIKWLKSRFLTYLARCENHCLGWRVTPSSGALIRDQTSTNCESFCVSVVSEDLDNAIYWAPLNISHRHSLVLIFQGAYSFMSSRHSSIPFVQFYAVRLLLKSPRNDPVSAPRRNLDILVNNGEIKCNARSRWLSIAHKIWHVI